MHIHFSGHDGVQETGRKMVISSAETSPADVFTTVSQAFRNFDER